MSDPEEPVDWRQTRFIGSRREQLRRAQAMSIRERLEALDQLTHLSERMQAMPRQHSAGHSNVREPAADYRVADTIHEIVLDGCTPTPLANYLKALGVLRLLSVKYPDIRGYWRGDSFVLRTNCVRSRLEQFFLHEYEPTPIIAPWNAGSGFYFRERKSVQIDSATGKRKKLGIRDQPTAATRVVDLILASSSARLSAYREAIYRSRQIVLRHNLNEAPATGKRKDHLILILRNELPDKCLEWLDAALAITSSGTKFPTLLGTGGNDGNMDFASNFMQRLIDVIGTSDDGPPCESINWLRMSLFGVPSPSLQRIKIGQFSPGQVGGRNATVEFNDDANCNPWDLVLALEGTLAFASAVVRRHADDPFGAMSYPFTVSAVGAGSGELALSDSDTRDTRAEIWTPLWGNPAAFSEIRTLMAEGRVAINRKSAKDALDFVRAVHHLGGYRGVKGYQRYGRLQRNGDNHLFASLGRINVGDKPHSRWLNDLDQRQWLDRFRQFARGANTAARFRVLRRRLEDMLFAFSARDPSNGEAQSLLVLMGEIQSALSESRQAKEVVPPVPCLSAAWVTVADDGNAAFRIAKALAGLNGMGEPLPLRAQFFPVHKSFNRWLTGEEAERVRIRTGQKSRLENSLAALLERRLWLARELKTDDKPLHSRAGVMLEDINAFLLDDHMDARIETLLPGLCLCTIPEDIDHAGGEGMLPAAFGLMKLALTPDRTLRRLGYLGGIDHLPIPAGITAKLVAGNHNNVAVTTTWRRLRASGLTPFSARSIPTLGGIDPIRAAAALLIPLRYRAIEVVARRLLK